MSASNRKPTATKPRVLGNAEWEAHKAIRRNLSPQQAVNESSYLSALHRSMWCRMATISIDLRAVLRQLRDKKIPFVLTGAHGIGVWTGRPRATQDIDLLVKAGRNHVRAVKAIQELYPQLEIHKTHGLTAFIIPGEDHSSIDVSCPQRPDNEETLRTAIWVEDDDLRYKIPCLEAALANKYGAMLALTRDPGKRAVDASDFYFMVIHSTDAGCVPIDLKKLHDLGEKVWNGGGGEEILRFVEEAMNGQVPNPNRRSGG